MPNLLYPYLVGVLATVIVPLIAIIAFIAANARARLYDEHRRRLPEATTYENLTDLVHDLQETRDTLREELSDAERVIAQADQAREWLERHASEIEVLEAHNVEFEQVARALADAIQRRDDLDREVTKLQFQASALESQCKTAEAALASMQAAVTKSEESLERLTKAESDTQQRLERLQAELFETQSSLNTLKSQLAMLAAQREQHQQLSAEIETLTQQKRALASEAETLRVTCDGLTQQVKERQSRLDELRNAARKAGQEPPTAAKALEELWHPAIMREEFGDETEGLDEADALRNTEEYLAAHGLIFPQRTVRAFHTSLKVANQTPLLVLAGISGTGKSLLPRRYAEAMGIHFLSVPVQPRWDGPQDLLGFFNYLENRYKATELMRAMLQMDDYCQWAPEDFEEGLSDRLLIVLLDEMNLARVEYYFSEFLSRLETRRDIDPDEEADRAKASILLDIGDIQTSVAPRVFCNTNVMFVGTMNEDETTQTLSDKVVDRAGVMRFAQPRNLAIHSRADLNPADYRAKTALSCETWFEWIQRAADRVLPASIEAGITTLNNALDQINRPFGYRTRDAILEYVRQYPDHTEHGSRLALADQIEQRILPKLRGLDITEPQAARSIQEICELAGTLGDEPLADAIDKAQRLTGAHLFTWKGVQRD